MYVNLNNILYKVIIIGKIFNIKFFLVGKIRFKLVFLKFIKESLVLNRFFLKFSSLFFNLLLIYLFIG